MKDNLPGSAATNDFLKKIQKNYDYLIDELKKFINLAENPPVDQMSLHEIVSEMGKKGWDPFLWHEQKFQQTGRMKDLIRSFLDRAMSPVEEAEKNHEKELERIVEKVRMQLWAWDNKGIYEPGAASVDISMFEQEGINQRQFVRSEFLTATTYHPEWGEDVREILKDTIITAGLRENEIFISRNVGGKEEEMILYFDNIHDPNERKKKLLKGDKILYTHDPNLFYPWLAEENGRPSLEKRLDQKFGEKSKNPKHEKAIEMARLLFTSFDMLTVSLMQLQRKTQTRAHNGGLDMVDLIMLFDPLAAYVHRSERYGFVVSDWVGWWLYFLKNIDPDSPDWGRDVGSDEIYKERAADFLVEKQKEIKLQQRAFYDRPELESEDGKRGPLREIDPLGPFESLFANPWQAMLLADGEVLELPDGTCVTNEGSIDPEKIKPGEKISDEYRDGGGVIEVPDGGELDLPKPLESSKTKLASFRLWMVAKAGWEEMLEITFKGIQNDASIEFLLEEEKEGGKGGLISRFIGGGAGRAKMFPGQHLEKMLGPMLLHLIRRTFQVYKGRGKVAETRLFREIMEGLDASKAGGLSHFKDIITAVEQELIGDKEHYDSMSSTLKKRENGHRQKETMQWMDHYHRHELKEEPPRSVAGYVPNFDSLDSDDRNYLLVQRNSPFGTIPSPLTRKGTMHHLKEEKH